MKQLLPLLLFCACTSQPKGNSLADADLAADDKDTEILDDSVFADAIELSDATDYPAAERLGATMQMLVWHDSILAVANSSLLPGEPLVSFYRMDRTLTPVASLVERGEGAGQMGACSMKMIGNRLFLSDAFATHRYCDIPLDGLNSLHPNKVSAIASGVEEHGVAIIPFRDGLLVENPQCYTNAEHGIRNDVPRLLYYENGVCLTKQEPTEYLVDDVNTGAELHHNPQRHRVVYASHRQPVVEFYDDELRLLRRVKIKSDHKDKIYIHPARRTLHRTGSQSDRRKPTIDNTRRVVGAGNQFHAFLCSCADADHLYLVYCGQTFSPAFHTFPVHIMQFDWDGNLVRTYRYPRWIWTISPSQSPHTFYLSVYKEDTPNDPATKLLKATSTTQKKAAATTN